MKKKILFVIPDYNHGGTNKCLENLLSFIDTEKYSVSIYSLYEDGNQYYKKLYQPYIIRKSIFYIIFHDHFLTRKIWGAWIKVQKKANFLWLYKREACRIEKQYCFDTVIAYQEGTATKFVSYMNHCNKVAWIHSDLSIYINEIAKDYTLNLYNIFNQIVCVSQTASTSFCSLFPILKDKTTFIHNPLNTEKISQLSKNEHTENFPDIFKIISVGRIVPVKQFDKIPYIVQELITKGCQNKFVWYIIGEGSDKEIINEKIKIMKLESHIKLLGSKTNPYPYIKKADLLAVTSKSESYPTVINEAKILQTPVISTNYPSASEIITESVGYICDLANIPSLLCKLIQHEEPSYSIIKKKLKNFKYDNESILEKFYSLL